MNFRLYLLQRLTAALMLPMVLGHLAVILYASSRGISASDILGRTRGSIGWGLFYGLFVLAAAVHGAIGIRNVVREWGPTPIVRSDRRLDAIMWLVGILLAGLGFRALYAVVS